MQAFLALSLACLSRAAMAVPDAGVETHSSRVKPNAGLPDARVEDRIIALERYLGGRIGFFAINTATGRTIEHRAHEKFAMCSTFKWLLAADVLSRAFGSTPEFSLERRVPYGEADLIGHAPSTREHVKEGAMTVGALVDATVEVSDNTAANLMLPLIGGPRGLTTWLRRLGDEETRLDRNEPTLNTNLPGDPRDTTTPAASAMDLQNLIIGDAIPSQARERLKAAMERCQTGATRLRAGVPNEWQVADKTGTCGERGAVNDVAVIWPRGHMPLVIAAYLTGSAMPLEKLEAAHAELARITVQAWVTEAPQQQ
jgi:beta-lactamase class A